MKKMITLSMLLVMTIVGLIVGYQNLTVDEIFKQSNIKIPFLVDEEPVVATIMTISKPFQDENVKVAVEFYDPTKENQEKSIITIDKTFIPNRGILYQADKTFDVLSIYDGTVLEVGKDDLTGNYVKINHGDNLIATYKILDNVSIKKGDYVKKGDKLGISGTSQIDKGNLLLFELQIKEINVNPDDYYNKKIEEI
jgi:murein DD-endopeptidase MepM/ murein hydrolase activator NlpD